VKLWPRVWCLVFFDSRCISDCRQFSDSHISQGSVATYVRCGGVFRYDYVANLPLSLSAKEFRKSVNISGSYGQEFRVFLLTVAH